MTVINGRILLAKQPIKNMTHHKVREHGVSWGLGEAGYDIRIKQEVHFYPEMWGSITPIVTSKWVENNTKMGSFEEGRFIIASTIEEFDMPTDLVGIVHDKSSWARQGLSVFNTVIESGWKGFLTLELVFHGNKELIIPAGAGIAQVIFSQLAQPAQYEGKYQNQEDKPVASIHDYGDMGVPGDNHWDHDKRGFQPK